MNKRNFTAGFLLLVLIMSHTVVKAANLKQERIVGGTDAVDGNWPWMVSLSWSAFSASQLFCGGSLIDKHWVLTAAHCVQDAGQVTLADSFVVYIGGHHLYDSPGQVMLVDQVVVHPAYDDVTSDDNDIALLRLSSPVTNLTPVDLITPAIAASLESRSTDFINDVTAIGWGDTEDPVKGPLSNILQQVDLPYINNSVCNQAQYLDGDVTSNMMCAGRPAGGIDTCQGDSGGPLVYSDAGNWYQTGVVSWGYGCAEPNLFGVYTRVENYLDWIASYTDTLSMEDLSFPPVVAGQTMRLSLSITNSTGNLVSITGKNFSSAAALNIENDQCSSLNSGQRCTLDIVFSPSVAGALSETITITSDSADFPSIQADILGLAVPVQDLNAIVGGSNPAPMWGSGGDGDWQSSTATGTEGGSSLVSAAGLLDNQSAWLVAHVNLLTERDLFFDWKVSSEKYFDGVELMLDGKVVDAISGEINWRAASLSIPAGEHVIHWRYRKDITQLTGQDVAWIDNLSWDVPAAMQVFGETNGNLSYQVISGDLNVGTPGLSWSTSIINNWIIGGSESTEGSTSLESAVMTHGEQSALRALKNIAEQRRLSFDLQVSSEPEADRLSFYINGERKLELSGEKEWQNYQFTLEPGNYTLLWVYNKDGDTSGGQDKVWLDNVKLSEPTQENGDAGGSISLYALLVLFLYAYMNPIVRKKRIN